MSRPSAAIQRCVEKRPFGPAKGLHVGTILAAAQHRAEGVHQNLIEIVTDILLPGVGNLGETGNELFQARWLPCLNPDVGIQLAAAPQVQSRGNLSYANPQGAE